MIRTAGSAALAALALAVLAAGCGTQPAPPSARVEVGGLSVLGAGAGAAFVAPVPDAKDGVANQNPPGTVEVYSTGNYPVLTLDPGPANTCAGSAIHADVIVRNYATEQLGNVVVQFNSMSPVSNTICNPKPSPGLSGVTSSIGLIGHGDLAGSAVSDGSAPGGSSTVGWWINYASGTFSFVAKVWADVTPAPPTNGSPAAGTVIAYPGTAPALSWSGATPQGRVQIASDPSFAATSLVVNVIVTGTGSAAPYAFTYQAPAGDGARRYWWRAVNRFVQPGGTATVDGTFSTGGSYAVDAPPAGLAAAAAGQSNYTLSATSWAPMVDFYSWNWSHPPFYYWTITNQYGLYTAPVQVGQTFTVNDFDPVNDASGNLVKPLIQWRACTQYGARYSLSTQGACANGPDFQVP